MTKSNFKDLGTEDSILAAHLNGLADGLNRVEQVLELGIDTKSDYALEAIADQEDPELQYRIYECGIRNWVASPAPTIRRNGGVVGSEEYKLYAGYGAVVFHIQQQPEDIVTADFTHLNDISGLKTQVDTNTNDIDNLKQADPGGGGVNIPFPVFVPRQYRNAALVGPGASYRGPTGSEGVKLDATHLVTLPFIVPETTLFDRIGTNVLQPGGGSIRFDFWEDNGGYPGAHVYGVRAFVPASGGLTYSTTDYTLEPGLYWLGLQSDGTQWCQGLKTSTLAAIATNWNPAKTFVGFRGSWAYPGATPFDPYPSATPNMFSIEDYDAVPAVFVRKKEV